MNQVLLSIKNLSVDFQTDDQPIHALQNISVDIEKGKTLAIVGESGSGKSVLALSIMGLLPSKSATIKNGHIEIVIDEKDTIDLTTCSLHQLEIIRGAKMGMIFQEPMTSLNPLMKCGQQVAESIMLHRKCSKREAISETIKLFEEVKLPDPRTLINRYPHELSGGQKQRVMIAMAISCNPVLLIADEPTTALDMVVQKTILDLLAEIQMKRNMSILFITHDLNLVREFADDVMILYRSKCIEFASTETIFSKPVDLYTKGLLNSRPRSDLRVKFLKTIEESLNYTTNISNNENVISIQAFNQRINSLEKKSVMLELKNAQVWYPIRTNFFEHTTTWFKAVNGVDMKMREGETMGLVGESGCGKTTIGKSIALLTKLTHGEIWYKGKCTDDFSPSDLADYRKDVQMIFQDPYSSLNPRISIGKAIYEPMDVHGIYSKPQRKEKVIELLEKVGLLADHYHRYPHEFSGGQRQRICIARALAVQPSFIICDESVSALDVSVQAQVLNLLVKLRDEFNLTYLFISHDLGVVKHISDHVAVMNKGLIVEMNDAEDLYTHPRELYTKYLIGIEE